MADQSSSSPPEKLTEQARNVLRFAQEEARILHHSYIGPEHILLGILREEDCRAAKVLTNLGAYLEHTRGAIELITSTTKPSPSNERGITAQAKRIFELSIEEARRSKQSAIGPEHLLLAIIWQGDSIAMSALRSQGLSDREVIRRHIFGFSIPSEPERLWLREVRSGAAIPPGFEAAIHKIERLARQSQSDPQVIPSLIELYERVLERIPPGKYTRFYIATLLNLGVAYRNLPAPDRTASIKQSIKIFQQALRSWTPEADIIDYARIQHNLGNALGDLETEDRSANLKQAISCYEQALTFFTAEIAPADYAAIQNSLGVTYGDLPGNRAENWEMAIQCFKKALSIQTLKTNAFEYAKLQNNLGAAFCQRQRGDPSANWEEAIQCYKEALRVWTPRRYPFQWAETTHNLGNAYRSRIKGDPMANLQSAISCYHDALRILTREAYPLEYAAIKNNLAQAYREMAAQNREDRANNIRQAIQCCRQALGVLQPEASPLAYRGTAHNLADLYFAQGAWDLALRTYREAMEAGEMLYSAGLSSESRAAEAFENGRIYPCAAFAAVRCGKPSEALLILERGKTRLLTEALHLRVRRPPQIPDDLWRAFELAAGAVRIKQMEQTGNMLMKDMVYDPVQVHEAHVQAVRKVRADFAAAIDRIRDYAPDFLRALDISTIKAQLADPRQAFLAFCITEQGSIGFIMSQQYQEPQAVEIAGFTLDDLHSLFIDINQQSDKNWFGAYNNYLAEQARIANNNHLTEQTHTAFTSWLNVMTQVLAALGERLIAPILPALPAGIERLVLLPTAELFLFPLHAAPLSGDDAGRLLCDKYEISYAPSLEVRAHAFALAAQTAEPSLYAVINPRTDASLPFAPAEGSAIAQLFAQSQVVPGQAATKERVLAGMQTHTYIHFSCHGSYNWVDPPASGLYLADERLTLADLQQNQAGLSTTRLVALSACETGLSDTVPGNAAEYVGIPAGFLLAGVPCVIGSLWSVPDISTAMLMEQFYYQHLRNGKSIAAALREAQRWLRHLDAQSVAAYAAKCYQQANQWDINKKRLHEYEKGYRKMADENPEQSPFAHPYYWAAFTVNGI